MYLQGNKAFVFFFDGVIVHSRNLNGIYSVNALFADLIKCISFCEPVEVVDVTAVRQYKVPGTLDCCDVKDFVLECFFGDRRPLTRRRWKRGRRTHIVLSQIPKNVGRSHECHTEFCWALSQR